MRYLIQRYREFFVRLFLPKNAHVAFTKHTYPKPGDYYHTEPPENLDPEFLWDVPSLDHRVMILTFPSTIDLKGKRAPELVPKQPWPEGYAVEGDIIDRRDVFMQHSDLIEFSAVYSTSAYK